MSNGRETVFLDRGADTGKKEIGKAPGISTTYRQLAAVQAEVDLSGMNKGCILLEKPGRFQESSVGMVPLASDG